MTSEPSYPPYGTNRHGLAETIYFVLRFLRAVRYRKSILISTLAVACLLGGVYYITAQRIYSATASLLILQSGAEVWDTSMSNDGNRHDLIPTYVQLFSSSVVIEDAIRKLTTAPAEYRVDLVGQPKSRWADILRSNLTARGVRRTNVIEIEYRSQSPQAAQAAVSAIVQS